MDLSVFDKEQLALLEDVSKFYTDRGLPIDENDAIIGFGKVHDFYQSYISVKHGKVMFTARKAYYKSYGGNRISTELKEENREVIFEALNNIYSQYIMRGDAYAEASGFLKKMKESRRSTKSLYEENETTIVAHGYLTADAILELCRSGVLTESDEEEKTYGELAARVTEALAEAVNSAEHLCGNNFCRFECNGILARYYGLDGSGGEGYRELGVAFGVSHEFARKECARRQQATEAYYRLYPEKFTELHRIMNAVEREKTLAFVKFGLLSRYGKKAATFLLKTMYGSDAAEAVVKAAHSAKIAKSESAVGAVGNYPRITELARFPAEAVMYEVSESECKIYDPASLPSQLRVIYLRLVKDVDVYSAEYRPQREAITLFSKEKHPDFLVTLRSGKRIFVSVTDTIQLASEYRSLYIKELERYCAERGYGYVVCDGYGRTREDLARIPVHAEAAKEFDSILGSPPYLIDWRELKSVREKYGLKNVDIAAYILQKGLEMRIKPFYVYKPRG